MCTMFRTTAAAGCRFPDSATYSKYRAPCERSKVKQQAIAASCNCEVRGVFETEDEGPGASDSRLLVGCAVRRGRTLTPRKHVCESACYMIVFI